MTDGPGFTPEETFELCDVIAGAYLAGMIPGTLRFSRVILGAGYRRTATPMPEYQPAIIIPDRAHYFTIGASEHHDGMFGWQCSCTESADRSYGDLAGAFGGAVAHVPAGDSWKATGDRG